ncbi:MAG: AAA family ATPase [Verrucomicrobiales bacterium]|nr:AAA family ATPase [Verrucomicrobiales bacterium]
MLKRFRINNFKSLLNIEFTPSGVNLVVGPNNAGKTNLCTALRLLALSSKHALDAAALGAVGERWNLTNFYVSGQHEIDFEIQSVLKHGSGPNAEELTFSYSLRLKTTRSERSEAVGAESLSVLEETLKASGGRFRETMLVENRGGQARMLHEEGVAQNRPNAPYYVQARAATNATMLSQLFELENNPRAILFRRYLQSWSYYNFSPESLRLSEVARDDGSLLFSGANLSRVLFDLHNERPRIERKLIDAVKQVEPKLDLLSYSSPDPEHVHVFLEDEKGNRISARSTSDGTLRFMAMAYVILMSAQSAQSQGFAPVVIIEEPENGLYVGLLKPLVERISPTGETGQFIFTSHSPYFIDLFDANLSGIHIVRPGSPSSVLSRPDPDSVRRMLDEMPLGEMHFRSLLQ